MVVHEMCANRNGIATAEIQRKYKVGNKTAWYMAHRLREGMKLGAPDMLRGTIVSDETWIGGNPQRMNAKRRAKWAGETEQPEPLAPHAQRANQMMSKVPVVSLIDAETDEVRSRVLPKVTGQNLRKVIAEQVDMANSTLWTDEGKYYLPIGQEFASHATVNHAQNEYVGSLGQTTNHLENYFSQLKRSIDGTYHHVSEEHLPRYLAEFDFRHSTHKISDEARVARLMGQVGGRRISYKRVKG